MKPSIAATLQQAVQAHQQGRVADAERLYGMVLAHEPASFDALCLLGALKMQRGQAEDAIRLFDRAVAAKPGNADAHYNRAVALDQVGRLPDALAAYDQVLAMQPRNVEAWFNRGNVLVRLARHEDAIGSYDRALTLSPDTPDILNNRGSTLAALERHDLALASFEQALRVNPNHVGALNNQAGSLKSLGRYDEALAISDRALAMQPGNIHGRVARANVLHALGRYEEAVADYDRALAVSRDDTATINNRVISLLELGRIEEAFADAERSVALDPGNAGGWFSRANALQALARDDEALEDYEKAIALRPSYADAHYNRGTALQALERHAEAITHFASAMRLRPDMAEAKWNGSASYLSLGRFAEGWQMYESRWARHIRGTPPREYPQPRWDGKPVPGVLLVWGEQGPGDQVLYASLVPLLKGRADKVILEVDPRLVNLFARSFPDFESIGYGPERYAGRIDAHAPIGDLPKHFLESWDSFPRHQQGYLLPDADRVRTLRERLTADGRRVIGLTWISRNSKVGKYKSARLRDFEALLRLPGYRFVDLQYGDTSAERDEIEREFGVRVEHLDEIDNMNDIDGLAALIAACDAVLTVSSTTAHLAGAVGAPTWVMVPFGRGRFWYWFAQRQDSPWYPRVQVRRQGQRQGWAELIETLVPEVVAVAATSPRSP